MDIQTRYNCIVMLQLASHLQCMWTNPGIAKDFLDQETGNFESNLEITSFHGQTKEITMVHGKTHYFNGELMVINGDLPFGKLTEILKIPFVYG